jgi:hypothetical protein
VGLHAKRAVLGEVGGVQCSALQFWKWGEGEEGIGEDGGWEGHGGGAEKREIGW